MDITFIIEFTIAVILVLVIPYLKNKFGTEKVKNAYEIIKILVRAVEQVTNVTGAGKKKKAEVMERLKSYNITLDEAKVSELIESAVLEMNKKVGE